MREASSSGPREHAPLGLCVFRAGHLCIPSCRRCSSLPPPACLSVTSTAPSHPLRCRLNICTDKATLANLGIPPSLQQLRAYIHRRTFTNIWGEDPEFFWRPELANLKARARGASFPLNRTNGLAGNVSLAASGERRTPSEALRPPKKKPYAPKKQP